MIADIWGPDQRGDALAIFSLMPTAGPALAPLISGFMYVTNTDYKWIFWVLMIFAGVCFVAMVIILPETYVPFLLQQEAKRLRKETGDARWISALERSKAGDTVGSLFKKTIAKPFIMIVQEPMLAVLTLYVSFIYGLIYLLFEAIPIVFVETHGLNAGEAGCVFLALLFGCVCGCAFYMLWYNKKYVRMHHAMAPKLVPPEVRLEPVLHAAPFYALAFFIFGWTGFRADISMAGPIIAVWLMGVCILLIFLGIFVSQPTTCAIWPPSADATPAPAAPPRPAPSCAELPYRRLPLGRRVRACHQHRLSFSFRSRIPSFRDSDVQQAGNGRSLLALGRPRVSSVVQRVG